MTKLSGFEYVYPVSGRIYPRKIDIDVLASFISLGATPHKIVIDLRLLASLRACIRPA